jgi:hypothetical protein
MQLRRPGLRYVNNIEMNLQVIEMGIELMWHKGRPDAASFHNGKEM